MIRPIKNWKSVLGIILLGLFILLLPHLISFFNGNYNLLDDKSYFNLNVANQISNQEIDKNFFILEDENAYHGRQILLNPYQVFLYLFNSEIFSRLIPIFLGLISLFLIYLVLRRLNISDQIRTLTMAMVLLSPIFIYTFSFSNKYSLAITLMLLGFYFFLKESWYTLILSCFCFLIVPLFGNFESTLSILLLLGYVLITKQKKNRFIFVLLYLIIMMVIFNFVFLSNLQQSIQPNFLTFNFFKDIISDFGSEVGLGLFKFLLGIIGLAFIWNQRNENKYLVSIFAIIIFSVIFYDKSNLIYANLLLSYLAAIGLDFFINRKWHVEILKYLTLITIFSGLLFSSVSYIMVVTRNNYTVEQSESLLWLNENQEKGIIFSYKDYGFFINYYSEMPVLMDSYYEHNLEINNFYRMSENLFNSTSLRHSVEMLEQLNIDYIWITQEMKEGLVWDNEIGLLFLLRNRDHFEKIYENEEVQIYRITQNINKTN